MVAKGSLLNKRDSTESVSVRRGTIIYASSVMRCLRVLVERACCAVFTGHLRFTNLVLSDSLGGDSYVCIANNPFLRSFVQGDDQKVRINAAAGKNSQFSDHIAAAALRRTYCIHYFMKNRTEIKHSLSNEMVLPTRLV